MTLLDGILIVIMLVSALLAMIRGFTREVFSIASWVVAALATYSLWDDLLPVMQRYVPDKNLSLGLTVVGIFFITLILVTLITMKISDFILDSKAGPLDRTLGFLFGAGRGLLLVVIGVLFLNYFIPNEKQWAGIAEAKSKPFLDELGSELLNMLPEDPEKKAAQRLKTAARHPKKAPPTMGGRRTTPPRIVTHWNASLKPAGSNRS